MTTEKVVSNLVENKLSTQKNIEKADTGYYIKGQESKVFVQFGEKNIKVFKEGLPQELIQLTKDMSMDQAQQQALKTLVRINSHADLNIQAVRAKLNQDHKIGADFGKTANGTPVANGDYIKLNESHSYKNNMFKTVEIPQNAEIKVTGSIEKSGELYIKGTYKDKPVELKLSETNARYGNQYVNTYSNNPQMQKEIKLDAPKSNNPVPREPTPTPSLSNNAPKSGMKF